MFARGLTDCLSDVEQTVGAVDFVPHELRKGLIVPLWLGYLGTYFARTWKPGVKLKIIKREGKSLVLHALPDILLAFSSLGDVPRSLVQTAEPGAVTLECGPWGRSPCFLSPGPVCPVSAPRYPRPPDAERLA